MAWTQVASYSGNSGGGAVSEIGYNLGAIPADGLLMFAAITLRLDDDADVGTVTPPTGWTLITGVNKLVHGGGGTNTEPGLICAYKVSSSESATGTFAWDGSTARAEIKVTVHSHPFGVHAMTPLAGSAGANSGQTLVGSLATGNTASVAGADNLILVATGQINSDWFDNPPNTYSPDEFTQVLNSGSGASTSPHGQLAVNLSGDAGVHNVTVTKPAAAANRRAIVAALVFQHEPSEEFAPGTLSVSNITPTEVEGSWTGSVGGTGTVTEQLQWSNDEEDWNNVDGATSSPFTEDHPEGAADVYYLRVAYTDEDPETVYSNVVEINKAAGIATEWQIDASGKRGTVRFSNMTAASITEDANTRPVLTVVSHGFDGTTPTTYARSIGIKYVSAAQDGLDAIVTFDTIHKPGNEHDGYKVHELDADVENGSGTNPTITGVVGWLSDGDDDTQPFTNAAVTNNSLLPYDKVIVGLHSPPHWRYAGETFSLRWSTFSAYGIGDSDVEFQRVTLIDADANEVVVDGEDIDFTTFTPARTFPLMAQTYRTWEAAINTTTGDPNPLVKGKATVRIQAWPRIGNADSVYDTQTATARPNAADYDMEIMLDPANADAALQLEAWVDPRTEVAITGGVGTFEDGEFALCGTSGAILRIVKEQAASGGTLRFCQPVCQGTFRIRITDLLGVPGSGHTVHRGAINGSSSVVESTGKVIRVFEDGGITYMDYMWMRGNSDKLVHGDFFIIFDPDAEPPDHPEFPGYPAWGIGNEVASATAHIDEGGGSYPEVAIGDTSSPRIQNATLTLGETITGLRSGATAVVDGAQADLGDDGTGEVGNASLPYRTTQQAAVAIRIARGDGRCDGGTINLLPGFHILGPRLDSGDAATTADYWLTLQSADGDDRAVTRITCGSTNGDPGGPASGMNTNFVRLHDMKVFIEDTSAVFRFGGSIDLGGLAGNVARPSIMLDDVDVEGYGDPLPQGAFVGGGCQLIFRRYVSHDKSGRPHTSRADGGDWLHDCVIYNCGTDAFRNIGFGINILATYHGAQGTASHGDFMQFFGGHPRYNRLLINFACLGWVRGQGIFMPNQNINCAFVNGHFSDNIDTTLSNASQFGDNRACYVINCTFGDAGPSVVQNAGVTSDVTYRNSIFKNLAKSGGGAYAGEINQCHGFNSLYANDGTSTIGSEFDDEMGHTDFHDYAEPDYYVPISDSLLNNRVEASQLVAGAARYDRLGNARRTDGSGTLGTLGAVEATEGTPGNPPPTLIAALVSTDGISYTLLWLGTIDVVGAEWAGTMRGLSIDHDDETGVMTMSGPIDGMIYRGQTVLLNLAAGSVKDSTTDEPSLSIHDFEVVNMSNIPVAGRGRSRRSRRGMMTLMW